MAWKIELSDKALKQLDTLDKQVAKRLLRFMNDRILKLQHPREIGEALKGSKLGDYWKYRVGDYRLIASINDNVSIIDIVYIGNRREVYRNINLP